MTVDNTALSPTKINIDFEKRAQAIFMRIKKHYGQKLGRQITDIEAKEISDNLLHFAQTIYGL